MLKYFKILIFFGLLASNVLSAKTINLSKVQTGANNIRTVKISISDIDGKAITDIDTNDLRIMENGKLLKLKSINCNNQSNKETVSAVLTIDVSGSMQGHGMDVAKESAKAWIDGIPNDGSDCGIVSFSNFAEVKSGFTIYKQSLYYTIGGLYPGGGTDYNEALLSTNGAINLLNKSNNSSKVIIFLTDGLPNDMPKLSEIIRLASAQDIKIFTITLGFEMPEFLKYLAESTGAKWFDNVSTVEQTSRVFKDILKSVSVKSCTATWQGDSLCGDGEITYLPSGDRSSYVFNPNPLTGPRIAIDNEYIFAGQMKDGHALDTMFTITAMNDSIQIYGLDTDSSTISIYDDLNLPITLQKDSSLTINISYKPIAGEDEASYIAIKSNLCKTDYVSIWRAVPDPVAKPELRSGFGAISILAELNPSGSTIHSGYHAGAGMQIYFSKTVALRLTFGIESISRENYGDDIKEYVDFGRYASASLRINVLSNRNVAGYLMPIVKLTNTQAGKVYVDDYQVGKKYSILDAGAIIGAEFFPYHNIGIACEYNLFASKALGDKYYEIQKQRNLRLSNTNNFSINSNFRFLVNYYIH